MATEKEVSKDHGDDEEPKGGRPGPVDEGGSGGMATREVAPELVHKHDGSDNDD